MEVREGGVRKEERKCRWDLSDEKPNDLSTT
jgi:hypothetical protein